MLYNEILEKQQAFETSENETKRKCYIESSTLKNDYEQIFFRNSRAFIQILRMQTTTAHCHRKSFVRLVFCNNGRQQKKTSAFSEIKR